MLPRCSYCRRHREGSNCVYPVTRHVSESEYGFTSPATLMRELSMKMVQLDLDELLGPEWRKTPAHIASSDTVHALNHFR
jgi:hypothetical protein